MTKLSPNDVREIRGLLHTGVRESDIAVRFGINRSTVHGIATERTWRWLGATRPTADELEAVARHYGVTVEALVAFMEAKIPTPRRRPRTPRVDVSQRRGRRGPRTLSHDGVRAVREAGARGERQREIAERFGISRGLVSGLLTGRCHREVGGPITLRFGHRLTPEDVRAIRAALAEGERKSRIAERFGVTRQTIFNIATGQTWRRSVDD